MCQLDQQFSNDAGAKSFQWFGFQETKTDIKKLVAESIKIFERARPLNTGDQWQLEIVISDGLCEDHDTVQRLVRRARENRIMLVFVIIDGINNSESIMDMSQVKYIPDQFGNMQLKIDKYLDTAIYKFTHIKGKKLERHLLSQPSHKEESKSERNKTKDMLMLTRRRVLINIFISTGQSTDLLEDNVMI